MAKNNNKTQEEPLENQLWKAADKLRKNIDAAEYKHIVLGLIFLKYISDAFEGLYQELQKGEGDYAGADPEDRDEYKAENVFFVPEIARWSYLQAKAKQPQIGKDVDDAMDAIEKENPSLKGVLPKVYARGNLDPTSLGGLIDLVGNIALGDAKARSADVLGHVFEYFLGEFALAEGKKGGQFYTPRSVVQLLVEMLEPYNGRWKYGVPPTGNANYAWIQHFLYHLSPSGQTGFVLAKGALTSKSSGEGEIRKELVEARLVDCIVNLPTKLFLNTQIPASLWFLSRNKSNGKYRDRTDEILFIDGRNMGHLINRRTREFSHEDIQKIAGTYHNWRNPDGNYEDVKGFCKSASIERLRELDYVLTPGRYVGLAVEDDDFDFKERFTQLKGEFEGQLKEEAELNLKILENLARVSLKDEN
ncbi:MAG: type I restriction-modification system subunit M [Methanosarcinales archaeon]|nr:type I restriction-modification system subunit M [Methanosarcinales archaeon]